MFKGFTIQYPDYECITPQTGHSFFVRSLNVQDEEKLKGSLVTPTKVTEHLNRCLFNCITKKPDTITDFRSFLQNTTLKDREALMYAVYHITYEEIRNYDIRCGNCRKEYPVTISASSTFNINPYPDKDILDVRKKVKLPITETVTAIIRQPSLEQEVNALKELSSRPGVSVDLISETLVIDRFEEDIPEITDPRVYNDRLDILEAYLSLPSKDKRAIYAEYIESFGKYGIELKMKSFCQHCGNEEVVSISLVEQFFRMVYSS